MGLSVRSSRCAAISMIIFGIFFLVGGAAYITFVVIFGPYVVWLRLFSIAPKSTTERLLALSWYIGYPSLLAIITMVTGCIGICASARRTRPDTCLTATLFIFSLMVAALSAYTIYDFSWIVAATNKMFKLGTLDGYTFQRVLYVTAVGELLGLAILVFLLSSWAIICCIASFCCHTEVEPEPVPARQQMVVGQGAVMVPMMRTDTMHVMAPPNPAMVQAVPVMPVNQAVPVAPVNLAVQQPNQAMPMQVVASPDGMKTTAC